jgi:hypothetical protein
VLGERIVVARQPIPVGRGDRADTFDDFEVDDVRA